MLTGAIWCAWLGITLMVSSVIGNRELMAFCNLGWGLVTGAAVLATIAVNR